MLIFNLKRVNKEIEIFENRNNFSKYNKNVQNFLKNINVKLYSTDSEKNFYLDFLDSNNKLLLTIRIHQHYPFSPYDIIYNNITNKLNNRNSYFRNIHLLGNNKLYDNKILSFFYKLQYNLKPIFIDLKNDSCYCCNSLYCNHNWSPKLTIENILLEYLEIKFIAKYSKPYNYLNLLNIYNNLFENYFNKLPEELLNIIFNNM